MRLKRLSLLIAAYSLALPASAIEFNTQILNLKDHGNIDLSAFNRENYVAPGDYLLDVYLDGSLVAEQQLIKFQSGSPATAGGTAEQAPSAHGTAEKPPPQATTETEQAPALPDASSTAPDNTAPGNTTPDNASTESDTPQGIVPQGSYACITPQLAQLFDLRKEPMQQLQQHSRQPEQCISFVSKLTRVTYDAERQRLNITVPQAWLSYQYNDWTPPSRWDNGVPGMVLDYNLMYNRLMAHNYGNSENLSLVGTVGLNAGPWRLRSDYQYSYNRYGNRSDASWSFPQTYLFRPLSSISSRLSAGQVYFNSSIFDSFRFTGVSLESDLRMLPPSLQGYAPQISGVARTQAQVTLSQAGRIFYQASVPPGPFVLPPLNQGFQGTLDVTVRESDGEVKHWQVNTASVQMMVRRGQFIYRLSGGKTNYSGTGRADGSPFVAGEAQWGVFNQTTLYGGLIVAGSDYNSMALGMGLDLGLFGALSFDATRSDARLPGMPRQSGYSYRVNYAKSFDRTGTSLSFIGYRFSQKNFLTLSRFDSLRHGSSPGSKEKQSITASFSQSLGAMDASIMLSASRLSYWDNAPGENYQISINKGLHLSFLPGTRVSLSFSRNRSGRDKPDNQVYLSLNIPFGASGYMSYSLNRSGNGAMEQNLHYSRFSGNNLNWGVGASHSSDAAYGGGKNTLTGNMQYQSSYGQLSANASVRSRDYSSFSMNWSGGVTATLHGIALHQSNGGNEPRMMIDTNAPGVMVAGSGRTNLFGVAVVTASSYSPADTYIDVSSLPDGVEVKNSVFSSVLTEGAIGYHRVATEKGGQLYGVIRLADGKAPAFASQVISQRSGHAVGIVGEDGVVLLSGLKQEDRTSLEVKTADSAVCHLQLPEKYSLNDGLILLPCE